jgi:hypothetical protein
MEGPAQHPEAPREDSILFRREDPSGWDAFRLTLYFGFAVFSLAFLLSGKVVTFSGMAAWIVVLAFSVFFTVDGTYNALRMMGKSFGGLVIDEEGILERSSWSSFGRVFWEEIRAIHPGSSSFLGMPKAHRLIGLDVTESYLERRPAWIRFKIRLNRKVFRVPDLQFSSRVLKDSPEQIFRLLKKRLFEHELRVISNGKESES